MTNYSGIIDVFKDGVIIESVKRRVVSIYKKDCTVYHCKLYEVKINYRKGHGLYIDLRTPCNFMVIR